MYIHIYIIKKGMKKHKTNRLIKSIKITRKVQFEMAGKRPYKLSRVKLNKNEKIQRCVEFSSIKVSFQSLGKICKG